jgi:ZIP family zinc transporter
VEAAGLDDDGMVAFPGEETSETMNSILNIFLLSLVASLGTGLGGLLAVIRKPGKRTFGFLMGITAGVMISLSFLELVNQAWQHAGYLTATIGFGAGATFMFLVDFLTPHIRFGEKEIHSAETKGGDASTDNNPKAPSKQQRFRRGWFKHRSGPIDSKLFKTGMLVAIGIAIHNTPEGIAVGAGYMHTPQFGYFIAMAIALHNIPEGIATALPLCKSGMCRWDAFRIALLSGLTEPLGALFAALFLTSFQSLVPGALAFAGGVMTFITLDELIPVAREHGHQHYTAIGIILGAIFVFLLSGIFGV